MRRQVLPALERSVVRFSIHKRLEIIDAFLLLVPPSNETLLQILSDPAHPCHQPVVDSLATSAQVPILDLLTQLAHDTRTPQSALRIVAGRHDRKFLDYLLHGLRSPIPLRVLENFKRLSSVVWLNEERDTLLELDGRAQATAVAIANSGRRAAAPVATRWPIFTTGMSPSLSSAHSRTPIRVFKRPPSISYASAECRRQWNG
jgi:hypothetical protein